MSQSTISHVSSARRLNEKQLVDAARRALGISQKELASHLGMSEDQLYRRKTGEVAMPARLKSQLRMIVASGALPSNGVGTGSVTIAPRDPIVAAAITMRQSSLAPLVKPEEAQFTINFDQMDSSLDELEGAFLGVQSEAVEVEADSESLQGAHDVIAKGYPLSMAAGSGRVSVELLCGRLEKFGVQMPQEAGQMSRTQRNQRDTIFREYYRSHEALREWFTLLTKGAPEALQGCISAISGQLEMLAIAKMDLNSIYAPHLDRPTFDEAATEAKARVRPLIKDYLNAMVEWDQSILRDPYRLVDASNDNLSKEVLSLHGEARYEVVDHFSLAERHILREIGSLRREVRELIELRSQARQ